MIKTEFMSNDFLHEDEERADQYSSVIDSLVAISDMAKDKITKLIVGNSDE